MAVGQIRQQLHDETHQGLAGQPVGGAQVHHARVADQFHEDGSQPVVAAEAGLQLGAVAVQGAFGGLGADPAGVRLGDGVGGQLSQCATSINTNEES